MYMGQSTLSKKIVCMCVLVAQSCSTLCDLSSPQAPLSIEFSRQEPPEWVAIPFSRGAYALKNFLGGKLVLPDDYFCFIKITFCGRGK